MKRLVKYFTGNISLNIQNSLRCIGLHSGEATLPFLILPPFSMAINTYRIEISPNGGGKRNFNKTVIETKHYSNWLLYTTQNN